MNNLYHLVLNSIVHQIPLVLKSNSESVKATSSFKKGPGDGKWCLDIPDGFSGRSCIWPSWLISLYFSDGYQSVNPYLLITIFLFTTICTFSVSSWTYGLFLLIIFIVLLYSECYFSSFHNFDGSYYMLSYQPMCLNWQCWSQI